MFRKKQPSICCKKVTFNLPVSIIDDLDEAWIKLRSKLKDNKRITKTLVVSKAIEIALKGLESRSELSDLYIKLQEEGGEAK